ncbi:MAG: hypothetical protein CVU00_00750 [Bacteroidetes bacterium HGW-Bacteroidetes-17]|jgi:hypothetical protein|nr:MAG: hypothetical protein CVU00_00750 [Bacteroidetes bacterium HGW-Bacteroidetes-17]
MDNQELKNILIEELGNIPFKDKKLINEEGTIPGLLLERLILIYNKKKKFSKIMLIVLLILLMIFLFLNYFLEEEGISLILFGAIILIQIPQLIFHPDYKDNSKRALIFNLFKTMDVQEKS